MLSHFDWGLFFLCLGLVGIGIGAIYSATYEEGKGVSPWVLRQLLWVGAGFGGLLTACSVDYRRLDRWAPFLYLLVLFLLFLVPWVGSAGGGAQRWLRLGPFSLQPSELMKIALILMLARHFAHKVPEQGYRLRHLLLPALWVVFPIGLILMEPHLGTAGILGLVFLSVVFVAGLRMSSLGLAGLVGVALLPVAWYGLKSYQKQRLISFLYPDMDPLGAGYHVIQSKISVGSGMIWGKGFLQGTQSRLDFLPEKHTDFIFAVLAEEWGFVGALVLLTLYGLLLLRLLYIALKARDRFGTLLTVGVAATVFWQAALNIGMNTGMLPVVGVPLPFISYGGSALMVMMVGIGLAINVSARRFWF